ncbi:MAG TPA: metallophosphoesterase [Candidatus Avacidaminococcus intestinavium]|uniref:Metallophosphoesterase n=1 Tax=Candidatus Avacidaminococcus intestinavium TaxID=2840684 RepID=A0A9D1MQF5_9FIRM|nr:metallophosphoesterase [Candidatus Avacidaminococcus intestinavium]
MSIYAIGDLHLSGEPPSKPMTIFGEHWQNHWSQIKNSWLQQVRQEDTVIICGDISWALTLQEALVDLNAIAALPGHKILLRGNHDYWWSTIKKMTTATHNDFSFLHNNYFRASKYAICGTRGWNMPGSEAYTSQDETILQRECLRLENSLQKATADGYQEIIVALHYPPLYKDMATSAFEKIITRYKAKQVIFGHIHGNDCQYVFQGVHNNTNYQLVSADCVNFALQKII